MTRRMTKGERLREISKIIENVDHRAQAGDFVQSTLKTMNQGEMSRIYELASNDEVSTKVPKAKS